MKEDANRLPIIRLWNQILVPLQGEITDEVADRLRSSVLETIYSTGADGLVIDVTGVWTIDSHLCSVISRLAAAAQLMGTRSIICGMSADIAITLQTMGIEMSGVRTALTVEEAFAILGVRRTEPGRPTGVSQTSDAGRPPMAATRTAAPPLRR
jgi:rsbT antagonist protein RsbS